MKRKRHIILGALLALALTPAAAGAKGSEFTRLYPGLPALDQQSNQQLADLASSMLEPAAINNPLGTTGGITFTGQFADHDLTLDTSPQPFTPTDPVGLPNGRTFAFDLDSVYGDGPAGSPQLYEADGEHFKIGVAADGVTPDLPRNPDGSAILVEGRNDENEILSQLHTQVLRLHNKLVDRGDSFEQAHDTVVNAWRYVILNDYLPQITGLHDDTDAGYRAHSADHPDTPLEFSVAAFRFGHSQVRNAYNINDQSGGVRVFSLDPAVPDLRGGRQLPAGRGIDLDNFFAELPQDGGPLLIGRAIDTNISASLFELPIPGAEASGSNVLAFRNMLRAKFYGMPSYEDVARHLGVEPVGPPVFPEGTPLWYGILRESELTTNGGTLGPTGGRIVDDVFRSVLNARSGIHKITRPDLPDSDGGDFRIGDFFKAADLL